MPLSNRKKVIAGNWKMYKTISESLSFVETLAPLIEKSQASVYLAVPFTSLHSVSQKVKNLNTKIAVGAQNMHDQLEGAFTGEISARMLTEAGASFVILGHSERRQLFQETNSFINRKVKRALQEKLQPILCIGETEKERYDGLTEKVLKKQIEECLEAIEDLGTLILAYEPVWAIGTGKVAQPEDAEKAHFFCRKVISEKWGAASAQNLVIQYGGSVKPDNARSLLEKKEIDGFLVGGASLDADSFSKIIKTYQGKSI